MSNKLVQQLKEYIPKELWDKFIFKLQVERISVRAAILEMIRLYVNGSINLK